MSVLRSYFKRNNTIVYNSKINTGRNPVIELNFGSSNLLDGGSSFTRFIFDLDLELLSNNIESGIISTECRSELTHRLKMKNTSSFDIDLLNSSMSNSLRRATSFDLFLFRLPKTEGSEGNPQLWDEGVGYDYTNFNKSNQTINNPLSPVNYIDSRSISQRPSNWFQTTTITNWSEPGIYNNKNQGTVNFSDLHIIDTQHFEIGNEDIDMDMTDEINGILNGSITGVTGWGIAYLPQIENIEGLTDSYSVAFFSRHTQTFYKPHLETTYDDLVIDNRNNFTQGIDNKLYLYVYDNGDLINLDQPPSVKVETTSGALVNGLDNLQSCQISKGVYEVTIPQESLSGSTTPCTYYDIWRNLEINGNQIPNIENQFILHPTKNRLQISPNTNNTSILGFNFYGILQDEKILTSDLRKVGVTVKEAYSGQKLINDINVNYRIFVKEGKTEVTVQDWTRVNKSSNEYYFMLDMRDKTPNQYYIDIKVNRSGEITTHKKQITFKIVNEK